MYHRIHAIHIVLDILMNGPRELSVDFPNKNISALCVDISPSTWSALEPLTGRDVVTTFKDRKRRARRGDQHI